MKTRILLILFFEVSLTSAKNPYEHFGYDNSELESKMENLRQNKFLLINEDTTSNILALLFDFNLAKVSLIDRNGFVMEKEIPEEMQLRWSSVDPLGKFFPSKSPFGFVSNNPINRIDPDGRADYYTKDGIHRGNDGKDDNRTMLSQDKPSDAKKDWSYFDNATDLKIGHDNFLLQSATIYGESSAYKMNNMTDDLKKEMFAIASVHTINKKAYGAKSDKAKEFLESSVEDKNKSTFKTTSIAANINALTDGFDFSNGAVAWDGAEQSLYSEKETRKSVDGFELHINTMGWSISDNDYINWKQNVGSKFKAPQIRIAPKNYGNYNNKGKIRLISTAVYNGTIFWKIK